MRQSFYQLLSLLTLSTMIMAAPITRAEVSSQQATPQTQTQTQPDPIPVVASFSILANMAEEIGGPLVSVTSLVGPDSDAHVFNPSPTDARALSKAKVVVINGLGFEGWIDRLIKSSGFSGELVVASNGVKPLGFADEHESHKEKEDDHHDHGHGHEEDKHDSTRDHHSAKEHDHGDVDPHAWQDLRNGQIYAANIRDALIAAMPAYREQIQTRAQQYIEQMGILDQITRERLDRLAPPFKRVITSHDAFGYFGHAYGIEFFAAQGWSTDREVSAADMATIIREIRHDDVRALFVENMSDPRLMQRISEETGVRIGGALYSDALSAPGTQADTYLKMFETNVNTFLQAIEP